MDRLNRRALRPFVFIAALCCYPTLVRPQQDLPKLRLPGHRPVTEVIGSLPANRIEPERVALGTPASTLRRPELLGVSQIWAKGAHNAFTDLVRFRERWYCAFREASGRFSADGVIRLITSADGDAWGPSSLVTSPGADLRDPKLGITPDRRLMLTAAARYEGPAETRFQTLTWYSLDGRDWADPFKIGDPDVWLWRINWHRGNAYSVGYSTSEDRFIRLYVGPEGLRFRGVSEKIYDQATPTEATLLFNSDDSSLCLLRRDAGSGTTLLGRSRPPYRSWEWQDLGVRLSSPNMIRLPDGRIVAAGSLEDSRQRTALCWLDERQATLREFLTLPSAGDASYPGLAFHQGLLWISYHSSHEGRAAIYLAKVRLPLEE
jgi:hypothetical protein